MHGFLDSIEKKYLAPNMATIKGNPNFNAEQTCREIFDSLQISTKEETTRNHYSESEIRIIEELTNHNNDQRQNIRIKYKQLYGFDLKDHIKVVIFGDLQEGLVSLLYTPAEYDARTLHSSLTRLHQQPLSVIEILATRNSYQLRQIERVYNRKFKTELSEDLKSTEFFSLSEVLRALLASNRPSDHDSVDIHQATLDAKLLQEAGEDNFRSHESEFIKVLCQRSFEQLRRTFDIYREITGIDIRDSIKAQTTGYYQDGLLTIVECVKDIPRFFAERLYKDIDGSKTKCLIRCLISRAEIDLEIVKQIYEGLYGKSLYSKISEEIFGCYALLLKLIIKK